MKNYKNTLFQYLSIPLFITSCNNENGIQNISKGENLKSNRQPETFSSPQTKPIPICAEIFGQRTRVRFSLFEKQKLEEQGIKCPHNYVCRMDVKNGAIKIIDGVCKIPEGTTVLEDACFWNNMDLTQAELPASIEEIGSTSFADCKNLTEVVFLSDGNLQIIKDDVFRSTKITHIEIPYGVKKIGKRCFASCPHLVKVTLPLSLTEIGDDVFKGCRNLIYIIVQVKKADLDNKNSDVKSAIKDRLHGILRWDPNWDQKVVIDLEGQSMPLCIE